MFNRFLNRLIFNRFTLLVLFILFNTSFLLSQTNYYVAKNGSNSNAGTSLSSPFLTISHAISQINAGDKIYIRRGIYHEALIIDNIDSTLGNETLISNYNNEEVIIDGTISINGSWTDDTIGGVAVKKNIGITQSISQLFVGNNQMVMARWPNAQFSDLSIYDHDNWAHGEETGSTDGSFLIDETYENPGALSLANSIGILNVGSFRTFNRQIATHTQQGGDDVITYTTPIGENGLGAGLSNNGQLKDKHHHFFFEGKKEFIDAENEWFLDTTNDILYLKPPNGVDLFQTPVRGKIRDYSLTISGSEHLKINGLTFFATTIHASGTKYLEISKCNFYYPSHSRRMLGDLSGANATTFGTGSGNIARVDSSTVSGCLFINTEGEALVIRGNNNTVKNSYFRNIDWSATEINGLMVSVFIDGTQNTFTGNEIYYTGASATVWPGEQSIFSYNIVSSTGHAQSDGSVFQGTKNYVFGSEVHHNFVYDTEKYAFRYDAPGGDAAQAGSFGVMHHNIADNTLGLMIKGNNQIIAHNTVLNTINNRNDIIILAEDCSNTNTWLYNNLAERIGSHRSDILFSAPSNGPIPIGTEGYIKNGNNWEACDSNDGSLYSGSGTGSSTANIDSINQSRPGIVYNANIESLINYNPGNGKTVSDYQPISNVIIDQGISLTNTVSTSLTQSDQLNSIVPHIPVGSGTDIGAIDGNSLWTPGIQGWTPQQNINLEDIFYDPGIVESNLLLHFDFANSTSYPGSGNKVYDLSDNYNQGDLNGNPSMLNNNGGVIDLDGSDDYIQLSDPFSYQQHTIEMWIKMRETGNAFLWDARDSNDDGYILWNNNARYSFFINTNDNNNNQSYQNQWVQVVASYNGDKSRIFINGQKVNQSNSITNNSINNNTNVRIGARSFDPVVRFAEAEIGIVRFYDKTLNSVEVIQNYNANASRFGLSSNSSSPTSIDIIQPIPTRGLKLYLDTSRSDSYQSGSTTWYDLSGNNYDFTVAGSPPFDSSKKGGVIDFQAGGDYATNNSDPILNVNSYTKFAVFKPLAATSNNIISGGNKSRHAFWMNGTDDRIRAGHNGSWALVNHFPNGQNNSILNSWHLSAVSFDTINGFDLYYNGNLVDSNSSQKTIAEQTSPLVNIARYQGGNYFTGYIPVAIIYDRKLSKYEVNRVSNFFASKYGLSQSNTSSLTIDEGVPLNTVLGDLNTTDSDSTQFNYELVNGNGVNDQHNSSFTVSGTQIIVNQIISYDNTPTMNINLKTTDETNNSLTKSIKIYVNDLNRAPTDIGISSPTFSETIPASSTIATLSAVDSDTSDNYVFSLIAGDGSNDVDNSSFTVSGTSLIINSTANYETKPSYSIYINVNDGLNNFAKAFTLNVIDRQAPSITFNDLTKVYGDANFNLTATSSSTGAYTYNILNTNVATVNGNNVTITGAGITTITVSQAEDSNYNAATASMTLTINKALPIINFDDLTKVFGDANFNLTSTSSSTGAYNYNISNTNVVNVTGNTVTIIGAGSTAVTVTQVEDSNYRSAKASMTITINKADPGIGNFNNINKTYGDPNFEIIDPSKNNLNNSNFIYSSSNSNIASVTGKTISINQAGSVIISATLPADNNFNATVVSTTLNINKSSQTISIGSLPTTLPLKDFNTISLLSSSTSGTPVNISLANGSAATLNGTPGNYNLQSIQQTGLVTITFYVDENSSVNYSSASVVLVVDVVKVNQNITFDSSPTNYFNYSENLSIPIQASASSSLPLSYNLISGNASLNSNIISVNGTGQISVELKQIGNNQFNAAPPLNYTINIGQGTTSLSGFTVPSKFKNDLPFQVTPPISNRVGQIVYSSSNLQVATITGNQVTILNSGQTTITAEQIANNNYKSATVSDVFIVLENTIIDSDNDGISDENDNCTFNYNPIQEDYDNDGLGNICDNDDDNDGYNDLNDKFPLNPNEWYDNDNDGLGDNEDEDDDNDSWSDTIEISCNTNPLDNSSFPNDYDGDSIPDCIDQDTDNDGYPDNQDDFPENELEWIDTDKDGIGDNEDKDDDGDGYSDNDEIICESDPLNSNSKPDDLDQDFVPNCIDLDDDNDGCLDDDDAFPFDNSECLDNDDDGIGDNADDDDDNDGVYDLQDAFPFNSAEQKDTDGDGIGDNSDSDYNSDGLRDDVLFPSQFFSPNGDGINDTWNVVNTNLFPNCEVWIYTRSGELIFNKKGYANDWTGLLNGQPIPEASYVYMVDQDGDGIVDLKGWFYLTR